jgi:rRNA-processing protein FCF1
LAQASSASPHPTSTRPAEAKKKRRRAVAFDSSFLVAVMERPTPWNEDILEKVGAFTPVILASVRDELARLAAEGDKRGRFAALALRLLEEGTFSLEQDGRGDPDDEIISFALREGAAVATIDSELAERLRASRVQTVITLRGGRVSI